LKGGEKMSYLIYSVEDDKDISKIINRTLSKQGYEVMSFFDGESFLAQFNKKKPDMVLLDMMLPDYSGSDLLKRIRLDNSNDDIQVIIISANSLVTDKIDGLDMGADDYISKPFDLMELVSRVNARFRQYKKSTVFTIGNIELNTEGFEVKKDGKIINLTVKEFEVLEILFKHRGKVVSRDEILLKIWGDSEVETRVIDMHINSLRKKLDSENLIETIYGRGYKIA